MRWSIRNQILVPLIGIQAVAVTAATLTTATLAASRSEREIIGRLNDLLDTLEHGSFPYTRSVLAKMRGLSGAHFIAWGPEGEVTETSLPTLEGLPLAIRRVPAAVRMDALAESPSILLGGTRYFAVSVRSRGGPRGGSLVVLYPETSWRQARREAAMPALLLGIASLGLMVLVTSWIAHRMSSRIRRVQQQVAGIAAGDFRELDPGGRRDEVADLTVSINRMCSQLQGMRQTIQQSERAGLLAKLAAGLAHQLRNSLTGARMSVQLHAKRHPAQAGDEALTVALRQLELTEEQVKGLLSAGRVERTPPERCDLQKLLGDVARLVDPACQHARVTLSQSRRDGAGALELFAERSSLRAAIVNLALNAIEAAGQGGTVSLEAYSRDGEVSIEVVDSGPGPPADLAEVLYEPFVTSKPEGVGLGLALARQVALDHDGRLSWARAGEATRFTLTLPQTNGPLPGHA
jgi:signal transduction histidine kinase